MERLESFNPLESMKKVIIDDRFFTHVKAVDFVLFPGETRKYRLWGVWQDCDEISKLRTKNDGRCFSPDRSAFD